MCVCVWWGRGQGRLLAMSCPKPQNEICVQTRNWLAESLRIQLKESGEGREKEMLSPASGTDLRLTSALLSPTGWVALNPGQPIIGRSPGLRFRSPQVRSPGRPVLGREVGVAGQPNPSKEKVLLHYTSRSKWGLMKCGNEWNLPLGEKAVLTWFLGANACWVLV